MLEKDSKFRLGKQNGMHQILAHPWFNQSENESIKNRTFDAFSLYANLYSDHYESPLFFEENFYKVNFPTKEMNLSKTNY